MKIRSAFCYRMVLISLVNLTIILGMFYVYKMYYDKFPETIVLETKKEQVLSYDLPVSASIYVKKDETDSISVSSEAITEVDFARSITFVASKPQRYVLKTKLFGVIPLKNVDINVVDEVKIIPLGVPVGIYAKMDGLLVVDTGDFKNEQGKICMPSKDLLYPGDYILKINGVSLKSKYELVSYINQCNGEWQILTIERDGTEKKIKILPQKNEAGEYKLGIWIKDNVQGIGTLTYLTQTGEFGALGHGIIDMDIQTVLRVKEGNLYPSKILGVQKGTKGTPGEMSGVIFYGQEPLGSIRYNSDTGIYGDFDMLKTEYLTKSMDELFSYSGMEIAYKNEIQTGKAQILCTMEGKTQYFDINIDKIYPNTDNINKSMKITITDEKLLNLSGGIVQGMSGSPIIQEGKIVGAVTHVLVNDSTRGYGIFIENMLEH